MSFVRRISIRARLTAAVSLAVAALIVVAGVASVAIGQLGREFSGFFEREYAAQERLARLQLLMGEMRSSEKDTVLAIDDLEAAKRHQARWQQQLRELRQALAELRSVLPAATVDRVDAALQRYAALAGDVLQKGINGQIVTSTEEHQALQPARDALAQALPVLDAAAAELRRAAHDRHARVAQHADERPRTIALLGVLTLAALGAALLAIVRSVTCPLADALQLAHRVADGDLAGEVQTQGDDELAALMRALAAMQQRLRDMVGQLHHASGSIAGASAEVAAGSRDLSARSEQAAARLQHSAASLGELRGLVQRAEAEALGATAVSEQAGELARAGVAVVSEVAERMAQLSGRSRRIADITGVIDAIAFQTNLLALNAAVEAARAGEQGCGFAVVAGEVRALAQRATAASAEIRGLIDSSVHEIAAGAQRADAAGRQMQALIEVIGRLAAGMAPLAEAARLQTRDVAQVHAAMDDLQDMTRQNAALVQQSLASAQSLQSQADRMAGLVGRFRLQAVTPVPAS